MASHSVAVNRLAGLTKVNQHPRQSTAARPASLASRVPVALRAARDGNGIVGSRARARLSRSAFLGLSSSRKSRPSSMLQAEPNDEEPTKSDERQENEPTSAGDKKEQKRAKKKDELLQVLQKSGMDKSAAQQVLSVWKGVGIESAEDMRKLLRRRTGAAIGVITFQTLLDAAASYFSASAGAFFYLTGNGLLSGFLGTVGYTFAVYYALNVLFGLIIIVSMLASGVAFGYDSEALLGAVTELGGEGKQLDVVSKAKEALNMVKIVGSLNEVSDILRQSGSDSRSTLDNLGVYLTLSKARSSHGFDPEEYGLSEKEAADVAAKFSKFDLNDDGVLEKEELDKLFSELKVELSPAETDAALGVLDKRQSGAVEFDEFVDWYCRKIPETATAQ